MTVRQSEKPAVSVPGKVTDRQMIAVRIGMEIEKLLNTAPGQIRLDAGFIELGINSSLGVELVESINEVLGCSLGVEAIFDYPDIDGLACHIAEQSVGKGTVLDQKDQPEIRIETVQKQLERIMREFLQLSPDKAELEDGFLELGINSSLAVDLVERINQELGTDVGVEAIFDCYGLKELSHLMANRYLGASKRSSIVPPGTVGDPALQPRLGRECLGGRPPEPLEGTADAIAIIGISGRFAGAETVAEYWKLLSAGKCGVRAIDREGWDESDYYNPDPVQANKSVSKWGGLLNDIDKFDPLFFGISPREAERMDPQQRLFLQEAFKAFEDSGHAPDNLSGKAVGVFVGARGLDYKDRTLMEQEINSQTFLGTDMSILAARIAFFLNLKGPGMAIDTACSSSLVAIHLACESLKRGESELALAGGVFAMSSPEFYIMASKTEMLSPEGKCKTFDNSADGIVVGEGVGALVLRRLQEAIADGDHIYGVIKGTAVNQDGRTKGITAPSSLAQQELISGLYRKAGIEPESISYIEAHGTGTRLGDPIEVKALTEVFREFTDKKQFCAIGSHKPNIGHTIMTAGVAGIFKILMGMKYKQLPPTIHLETVNQYIDFENSPFYLNTQLIPWINPQGGPLRAGISSFGFSGTNCHLVIEEAPLATGRQTCSSVADDQGPPFYLIALSARNETSLLRKIADLGAWLEDNRQEYLSDISYTLQTGRNHFPFRAVFIVKDIPNLQQMCATIGEKGLRSDAPGDYLLTPPESWQFRPKHLLKELAAKLLEELQGLGYSNTERYREQLLALAELYVAGFDPDWAQLYRQGECRRVPLPTYPFLKERYWSFSTGSVGNAEKRIKSGAGERPEGPAMECFVPNWKAVPLLVESSGPSVTSVKLNSKVLIVYSRQGKRLKELLAFRHQSDDLIEVEWNNINQLELSGRLVGVQLIYFLSGLQTEDAVVNTPAQLEENQEQGVMALFRLLKALNAAGVNQSPLKLRVVTNNVYQIIPSDRVIPYAASLHGFVKSLAKEYPHWELGCFDISTTEAGANLEHVDRLTEVIIHHPLRSPGEAIPVRFGKRYTQIIEPLRLPMEYRTCFKHHGVYFILGGTGGIGLELSRYLAKKVQARLVLVSRRDLNSKQREQIEAIESYGGQVLHIKADAADPAGLEQAVKKGKSYFGKIDGVIHSAMVLQDQSFANMTETTFQTVLEAKVKGSFVLHQVFQGEKLDFMVFFSSVQPFIGNAGQSNYAAACAFKDAYAHFLSQRGFYPVKIVNWGYWGSVGAVATGYYQEMLKAQGCFPIRPEEGLDALEQVMGENSPVQVISLKATEGYLAKLGIDREYLVTSLMTQNPSILTDTVSRETIPSLPEAQAAPLKEAYASLNRFSGHLLLQTMQRMGIFQKAGEQYDAVQLKQRLGIIPLYDRLYEGILEILARSGWIQIDRQEITTLAGLDQPELQHALANLEASKVQLNACRPITAYLDLLWECLAHFPAIVQGKLPATEIIFPDSTLRMVEGIYRDNVAADYYNDLVVWSLLKYVERSLPMLAEGKKLNILEIGAGTGSTSRRLIKALEGYGRKINYLYTDISQAFVQHGRKQFGSMNPFVEFKILDMEKEVRKQGFAWGEYDVVVATNVLHTARNIQNTLMNIKALLKTNGWLILNELTAVQEYLTLTFGLLEGWWLYETGDSRLPGSPLLGTDSWRNNLAVAGFKTIHQLDTSVLDDPNLAWSVLIGESNGLVRIKQPEENHLKKPLSEGNALKAEVKQDHEVAAVNQKESPQRPHRESGETPRRYVERAVMNCLSEVLFIEEQELQLERAFSDFGVDSILALEVIRKINARIGTPLKSTDLFNYATIAELTHYILRQFGDTIKIPVGAATRESALERARTSELEFDDRAGAIPTARWSNCQNPRIDEPAGPNHEEIAIIGMAGQFPGAKNLDQYWANLAAGKNLIQEIKRWDLESFYDPNPKAEGRCNSKWGGFLNEIDCFDPLFFNISPKEAELMDPQHRIFLEEAWKALEDAGYSDRELEGKKCGVFVGFNLSDYGRLMDKQQLAPDAYMFTGNSEAILAARIAYFLNLKGPSITVNTACSSSLVSVHLACESIRNGTSEMALAGGVCILNTPELHLLASQSGMLAPDGQCKTFDHRADGFVPAEGVGIVVLKSLNAALRDGNHIYGVLIGSGINQDGRTNGITAPSAPSQTALEYEVYRQYQINPEQITLVEAHGTGTKLGDPIEIDALTAAFRRFTSKRQYCAIGSVKTNIGHALAAAGIAGLIKVALSLKHRKLVPSLNLEQENELIDFKNSPFYISTRLQEWENEPGIPRQAAISAFGFSGTNAHLVVREAPIPEVGQSVQPWYLIVFTAKTENALRRKLEEMKEWLETQGAHHQLRDISYTLMIGRSRFQLGAAFIAKDGMELAQKITRVLNGETVDDYVVKTTKELRFIPEPSLQRFGESLIREISGEPLKVDQYHEKLLALADLYLKGYDLDWHQLYRQETPCRISLPTYPFEDQRYWLPEPNNDVSQLMAGRAGKRLHPMIDANTSNFKVQRFTTLLTGDQFYLADHRLAGEMTLPGVAYLEMARAAAEMAVEGRILAIRNVMWVKPITVKGGAREVNIHLFPETQYITYQITTREETGEVIHAQGKLTYQSNGGERKIEAGLAIPAIKARCLTVREQTECYQRFEKSGLHYGASFRIIQALHSNEREALATLELPHHLAQGFDEFGLHPALMDGALQTVIGLIQEELTIPFIPFTLGEVEIIRPLTPKCYAYAVASETPAAAGMKKFAVQLVDTDGQLLVNIKDFSLKAFMPANPVMYFQPSWRKTPWGGINRCRVQHKAGLVI